MGNVSHGARRAMPAGGSGNDRRMLAQLSTIGFIPSADLERSRTFYERALGLAVTYADGFALVLGSGPSQIRLVAAGEFRAQPFTVAGWEAPDITTTVTGLLANGVVFERYDAMVQDELGIWTAPSGDRVAWFRDPDGNVLSLTSHQAG